MTQFLFWWEKSLFLAPLLTVYCMWYIRAKIDEIATTLKNCTIFYYLTARITFLLYIQRLLHVSKHVLKDKLVAESMCCAPYAVDQNYGIFTKLK